MGDAAAGIQQITLQPDLITPEDTPPGCEPIDILPAHLSDVARSDWDRVPQLCWGYALSSQQLFACAAKHGLIDLDSPPSWFTAMQLITDFLLRAGYERPVSCGILHLRAGREGAVFGLFSNRTTEWFSWGYKRDMAFDSGLRIDLGIGEEVKGMWWHIKPHTSFDPQQDYETKPQRLLELERDPKEVAYRALVRKKIKVFEDTKRAFEGAQRELEELLALAK